MNAKELMHNDFALLNGKIVRFNTYCGFVRLEDGAQFPRSIQVQPIPTTPEILEKNGFIQDFSYDECLADNCFIEIKGWSYYADNILITWDGNICKVVNDMGSPCEEITLHNWCRDGIYVHELQRALRCCGLWELAENFKVD